MGIGGLRPDPGNAAQLLLRAVQACTVLDEATSDACYWLGRLLLAHSWSQFAAQPEDSASTREEVLQQIKALRRESRRRKRRGSGTSEVRLCAQDSDRNP